MSELVWPIGLALATLAVVTVLVVLVSEIFVESVQQAAETFGMSQAFVGFIVVSLVGAAAEIAVAFSTARKDRGRKPVHRPSRSLSPELIAAVREGEGNYLGGIVLM